MKEELLKMDNIRLQEMVDRYKEMCNDYANNCKSLLSQIDERDKIIKELRDNNKFYSEKAIKLADELIVATKTINNLQKVHMN